MTNNHLVKCANYYGPLCDKATECYHKIPHEPIECRKGWSLRCHEMSQVCKYRGIVYKCCEIKDPI